MICVCWVSCLPSHFFLLSQQSSPCCRHSGFCLVSEKQTLSFRDVLPHFIAFLLIRRLFCPVFTWLLPIPFPCLNINTANPERFFWLPSLKQKPLFYSCMVATIFLYHTRSSYRLKFNCVILCWVFFSLYFKVPEGRYQVCLVIYFSPRT